MTFGSIVSGGFHSHPYTYQYAGWTAYSEAGYRGVKTWSGSDAPKVQRPPAGPKHYYTTLDRRTGKPVRRSYRWPPTPPRRQRERLPHPYTMSVVRENKVPTVIDDYLFDTATDTFLGGTGAYYGLPLANFSGGTWDYSPPSINYDANDDIALVGKLREKLYHSDFNAAVFLGEGHQTLRMIGDNAIKIARAVQFARKGHLGEALKTLSSPRVVKGRFQSTTRNKAGSAHLEVQYGLLPLLGDMDAGAKQLAYALNIPFRQRVAVMQKRGVVIPPDPARRYGWSDIQSSGHRRLIAYVSEEPSWAEMSGILDPELVLWELAPWSFVADWFAPFGAFLEARALANRLVGTFVTTTFQKGHVRGFYANKQGISSTYRVLHCDEPGWVETIQMSRTVANTLDVPLPRVKPLAKALSVQHCLNGLALMATTLRLKPDNIPHILRDRGR